MKLMKEVVNKKIRDQQENLLKLRQKKNKDLPDNNITISNRLLKPTVASMA
jgi:hypothetical protein